MFHCLATFSSHLTGTPTSASGCEADIALGCNNQVTLLSLSGISNETHSSEPVFGKVGQSHKEQTPRVLTSQLIINHFFVNNWGDKFHMTPGGYQAKPSIESCEVIL